MSKKLILGLVFLNAYVMGMFEQRPLNILFVVAYFPAPSQMHILNMMTGLMDQGHNVSIFSLRRNEDLLYLHPDIEKYNLLDRVIYETFPEELPECDIVFCQSATWGKKIIEMEVLAEWLKNKKVVVCLRGSDITGNVIKNDPHIYDQLFLKADLFLPVCDYFKKLVIQLGCDENKVTVHHSAINCSQFFFKKRKKIKRKQGDIQLVSVGRLVQKKGLEYAIQAVAQVIKRYNNVHFTIVGSGHLRNSLQTLAKTLGIEDKVTFYGWGTHEQVAEILNKSHIFLLPSITAKNGDEEGIANALKEAMAMGLISVATWHAGTPELIENEVSGFLVAEKNSDELADKIKYIIRRPKIWKSIGLAARKKIEAEFEVKKSIEQLEQLFYQLLAIKKDRYEII
jgi:colanic acid/amylovoran biosynthesis glycosyltransferase